MGLLFCFKCGSEVRKYEDDGPEERPNDINNIIEIKDSTRTLEKSRALYNNILEKNPIDDYIIKKKISKSKNQIIRKDDKEEKIYMMEKIDEYDKSINHLINEILKLDHQYISKIYYVYIYLNNYYIIYENFENNLLKGGEIDIELKFRKEIMERLFKTINYLHEQNIYNIGLNFDNFILQKMELKSKKKIIRKKKNSKEIDLEKNLVSYLFSLSVVDFLKLNYDMSSIEFYSPEIIKQIYIKKIIQKEKFNKNDRSDEWDCGLFLYYIITGELPFKGKDIDDFYICLEKTDLDLSSPKFNSETEKDLLLKLLEKDEKKRISLTECLSHPYITQKIQPSDSKEIEDIDIDILKSLFDIEKPASKFHEVIIAYLSYNFISQEEKNKINYLFNYIDTDKDNKITEEDLIKIFNQKDIKYSQEQIKHILFVFDYDLNNCIQYQEFSRHLCNKEELFKEENMKNVFNAIDINKNKYIDQQDVLNFIKKDESTTNIVIEKEFMEKFGMNVDDKITYEEYCDAIRNNKIINKENKDEIINENKIGEN